MKTLDDLQREHAQQIANLQREHAIASALPVMPKMITGPGWSAPYVSYEVKTLGEALEIFRGLTVIPAEIWKAGCTMVKPECLISAKDKARGYEPKAGPFACWVDVTQSAENRFGPTAELQFFARVSTGPIYVHVRFGSGYIGTCHQLRANLREIRGGFRNQVIERRFEPNAELFAICDHRIKWAYGGDGPNIATGAHFQYFFCADQDTEMPGVEHAHSLGMLEILADRAGV